VPGAPVVLVTGATDGIGRATAVALARRGATVLVHGRDPARVRAVMDEVRAARVTGPDGAHASSAEPFGNESFGNEPFVADLARLDDVRALASRVRERVPRLDVLVANAGVAFRDATPRRSADGFELAMAVNHLAHFLLAAELRPLLEARADEMAARVAARVAVVASELHARGRLDPDDPLGARRAPVGSAAYAASKLANVLFARALARRADPARLVAHALHPGVIKTKLLREGFGSGGGASPERGAATSVHVTLADDAGRTSGGYWADARPADPAPAARDDALGERLWAASAEAVAPWASPGAALA
jgi:NAD(P)-dependent dehydrogenase (short-subunit alcohol dehydrogenase family)